MQETGHRVLLLRPRYVRPYRRRNKTDRFASGRHLSAWLGMTPNEYSSGEQRRLGLISCKDNVYARTLLAA